MPIPLAVARFNRYITNPIGRIVAGWLPGFAIVEHRGRRSGRMYRTPLNIFSASGGFVIALTYGPNVDWLKNLMAAGSCTIRYRSRDIRLEKPVFISEQEGMAKMPPPVRVLLRLINVTEFVRLDRVS